MLIIGSHVSFTKEEQLLGSLKEALKYGSNTFMFYTGAPQNTNRSVINDELTDQAFCLMETESINRDNIIVHAPYIINLANRKEEDKYQFSVRFLKEEIKRCEQLDMKYLVLHPGSHVGLGIDSGIENIVAGLNVALENSSVTVLLETMAGKGTEIGSNFLELKQIIDGVNNKDKIGICLDTCHLSDSGHDINNFDAILADVDDIIGLSYVKCIHINDSKNINGARKDRHENIGFGELGFDALIDIIYNEKLSKIPKILETPWIEGNPPYKYEIDMIKAKKFDKDLKDKVGNSK